jgi:plastocyanin
MMRSVIAALAGLLIASPGLAQAGAIAGKVKASGMRDDADAVVYIEKIEGRIFEAPGKPVVMDQRAKEFIPKILPVLVGTTVDFLNSDPFSHNVFTPDKCAGKFNLGSWPTGEAKSYTFTEPCEGVMLCNVHPEMVGYVIVLETPYFAVTEPDGSYRIEGVPDGSYTVSVWHEDLDKVSKEINISGDTSLDLTLE